MSFSVIHLSDIHINGENDIIVGRQEELKRACVSSLQSNGTVVIAISGDIAFSGKSEQYRVACSIFQNIADYIAEQKKSTVYIVCAPGNHDCNFDGASSVRNTLIASVKPDIDLDYFETVSKVQSAYFDFAEGYGINKHNILQKKEIVVGENKILFLLADTAWMSLLNETPGKIIMPCHLFEEVSPDEYTAVFYIFHHPINWLDPDYKQIFIDHVRRNADIILVGHEHARDSYTKVGDSFSVYCSHGKELQDSNSEDSAFTVLNFDESFQNFEIIDYKWDGKKYDRNQKVKFNQYHKNIAAFNSTFVPNGDILQKVKDLGVVVNHFAKENVILPDLFVWPDFYKSDYNNEKMGSVAVRANAAEEFYRNTLNIIVGPSCSGKTTIAKKLFLIEEPLDSCCLLLHGSDFKATDYMHIKSVIERAFSEQYSPELIEEFRQLPKEKRVVIIDDFDLIRNVKGRRVAVLDFIYDFFGRVTIFLSSSLELTTILPSDTITEQDHVIYYEIQPLGNKKRKEIISKWYHLDEYTLSEEEIDNRVDNAIQKINVFIGNGNSFVPATPIFIIGVLQNLDAVQKSFSGSTYGFLYESLIISSLAKISDKYTSAGAIDIDISVLSSLAFEMLQNKTTCFSVEQLEVVIAALSKKHLLEISCGDFLQRIVEAKIIYLDLSCGNVYRFMYPYIFYYFCGKYIAYNLSKPEVQEQVAYMSTRLYNERYGSIIIFVCHFANNIEIIDTVLLNAYETLEKYTEFDFTRTNPVFEEIKDAVEAFVPKEIAQTDSDVSTNKETMLLKMDELGVNDGKVNNGDIVINDEITEKEKDIASVVAALKTIEVLGEILQNYPAGIEAQKKLDIIDEINKLGMRSVQAIIDTMGLLEQDLVEYVYTRATKERKLVNKDLLRAEMRRFINLLITGMARGMIHQVAVSLNSEHLLPAATQSYKEANSISSKLVLLDLKLNCLNRCNYQEIQQLKKSFTDSNETFASRIMDSIVGYYLNYHTCDHSLRDKLCSLCGLSQQQMIIAPKRNLLN